MARIIIGLLISYCVIQLLIMAYENKLANDGHRLNELQQQKDFWQEQNQMIEHDIATASALVNIEHKARALGFKEANIQWMKK